VTGGDMRNSEIIVENCRFHGLGTAAGIKPKLHLSSNWGKGAAPV
jgi:hypothetical protein